MNRGINESRDLPEEFLSKIYDEIENEEIKLKVTTTRRGANPAGVVGTKESKTRSLPLRCIRLLSTIWRYHQWQTPRIIVQHSNERCRIDCTWSDVQRWFHSRRIHHCQTPRTRSTNVSGMKSRDTSSENSLRISRKLGRRVWQRSVLVCRTATISILHISVSRASAMPFASPVSFVWRSVSSPNVNSAPLWPVLRLAWTQCFHSSPLAVYLAGGHFPSDGDQSEERRMPEDIDLRGANRRKLSRWSVVRCKWSNWDRRVKENPLGR